VDAKGHKYDVDHINGNKQDNRLCNLQYVSRLEHARKTRATTTFRDNQHTRPVSRISPDRCTVVTFASVCEAAKSVGSKTSGQVSRACTRSPLVGEWHVQYEDSIEKELPEFGGFNKGGFQTRRAVIATHCGTDVTRTYENASECAAALGFSREHVSSACSRSNFSKGYFWRYADEAVAHVDELFRPSTLLPVQVSSHGRIKMKRGCIVEPVTNWGDSRYKRYGGFFVHTLVADAFLGPPPLDSEGRRYDVDHIDGDPANNYLWNLQYLSRAEHGNKTHSVSTRSSLHKRAKRKIDSSAPSKMRRGKDLKPRKKRRVAQVCVQTAETIDHHSSPTI